MAFCRKCGREIREGSNFCGHCGTPIDWNYLEKLKMAEDPIQETVNHDMNTSYKSEEPKEAMTSEPAASVGLRFSSSGSMQVKEKDEPTILETQVMSATQKSQHVAAKSQEEVVQQTEQEALLLERMDQSQRSDPFETNEIPVFYNYQTDVPGTVDPSYSIPTNEGEYDFDAIGKTCPNCGAKMLRSDDVCKKCGFNTKGTADKNLKDYVHYRNRFILVLQCWIGGYLGLHLLWLGYTEEAKQTFNSNRPRLNNFFDMWLLIFWIMKVMIYQTFAMIGVLFGRYREDAHGNPIRYLSFVYNMTKKK